MKTGFDERMFMCGLADSEERNKNSSDYDPLTYFKCMLLLNSNYVYTYYDHGDNDYDYSGSGDYDYDYSGSGDYDYYSDYNDYSGDYNDYSYKNIKDNSRDYTYEYSSYSEDYDYSSDYNYNDYYYDYYSDYSDDSDDENPALYVFESDVRDYYQLATEICYLGKVLK